MSDILQNLDELKAKFLDGGSEDDLATVTEWERQLKRATLTTGLLKNDAMKMLLEQVTGRIETCNKLLLNDRKMTEKERDKIFERRDCYEWLQNLFVTAKATVKTIKAKVDNELTDE